MSIQTLLYTPQHKHTTHTTYTASPNTPTYRPLTQPPDAETRQISKQYFKLIQATHHKFTVDKSVTTHTYPPGMTRQFKRLTDFIKPSTPTEHTRLQIQDNTINWIHTNMLILQQHYNSTITTLQNIPYNPLALQIATGWARKRYGSRLTPDTLHAVQHTLNTTTPSTSSTHITPHHTHKPLSPITEILDEEEFPHLPQAEAPHNMTAFTGPSPSSSRTLEHWNTPPSTSPPSYRQSPVISKPSSLNTPARLPHPLLAPNPNPPPHLNPSSPNSYIIHNPYRRPTLPRAPHQPAARTDQPSTSASQKGQQPQKIPRLSLPTPHPRAFIPLHHRIHLKTPPITTRTVRNPNPNPSEPRLRHHHPPYYPKASQPGLPGAHGKWRPRFIQQQTYTHPRQHPSQETHTQPTPMFQSSSLTLFLPSAPPQQFALVPTGTPIRGRPHQILGLTN